MNTNVKVNRNQEDVFVEYLRYDGEYNLAVCMDCKYALPREWIHKHFRDCHKSQGIITIASGLICVVYRRTIHVA